MIPCSPSSSSSSFSSFSSSSFSSFSSSYYFSPLPLPPPPLSATFATFLPPLHPHPLPPPPFLLSCPFPPPPLPLSPLPPLPPLPPATSATSAGGGVVAAPGPPPGTVPDQYAPQTRLRDCCSSDRNEFSFQFVVAQVEVLVRENLEERERN